MKILRPSTKKSSIFYKKTCIVATFFFIFFAGIFESQLFAAKYIEKNFEDIEGTISKKLTAGAKSSTESILIAEVYFAPGSVVLEKSQIKILKEVARALEMHEVFAPDKQIRVVGHADSRGERAFNLKLGMARAEAVARYLELIQVPMKYSVAASTGESEALGHEQKFRKAEIRLEPKPDRSFGIWILLGGLIFTAAFVYFLNLNNGVFGGSKTPQK